MTSMDPSQMCVNKGLTVQIHYFGLVAAEASTQLLHQEKLSHSYRNMRNTQLFQTGQVKIQCVSWK